MRFCAARETRVRACGVDARTNYTHIFTQCTQPSRIHSNMKNIFFVFQRSRLQRLAARAVATRMDYTTTQIIIIFIHSNKTTISASDGVGVHFGISIFYIAIHILYRVYFCCRLKPEMYPLCSRNKVPRILIHYV